MTRYLFIFLIFFACKKEDDNMDCQNIIEIELINVTDAPCGNASGKIELLENPNLEYSIDNQNFSSTGLFENLSPGIYNIQARDEDGCEASEEFQVISGVSLIAEVMPIIETTCALSACHVAGEQSPDFSNKNNVISEAQRIRTNINGDVMPPSNTPGPELSADDLQTILCWIDDGANDN